MAAPWGGCALADAEPDACCTISSGPSDPERRVEAQRVARYSRRSGGSGMGGRHLRCVSGLHRHHAHTIFYTCRWWLWLVNAPYGRHATAPAAALPKNQEGAQNQKPDPPQKRPPKNPRAAPAATFYIVSRGVLDIKGLPVIFHDLSSAASFFVGCLAVRKCRVSPAISSR